MNLLINNKLCPQCLSSDIVHDETHALSYCANCGLVCKDETILNDNSDVIAKEDAKKTLKKFFKDKFFEIFGVDMDNVED